MMKVLLSILLGATVAVAPMIGVAQPVSARSTLSGAVPDNYLLSPADLSHAEAPDADIIAQLETIRADDPFFSSDFSDEGGPWRTESDGEVVLSYEDDAYHMAVTAADSGDFSNAGISVADFYVEVDAVQIAGQPKAWYGLFFRSEADDYGYVYTVNGDGAYQLLWVEEDAEPADVIEETLTADLNTGLGVTNRLGVLAQGSKLTLLANDIVLDEVEHEGATAGDIALVAFTQEEPGLEVAFDNFRVWELTEPPATEDEPGVTPTPPPPDETTEAVGLPINPQFDAGAVLASIRNEEPLYEESFLRDRGQWPTESGEGVERFFADKAYHTEVTGTDHTEWTAAGIAATDFLVEVQSAQVATSPGSYVGLLFRYADDQNFYAFLVNREGEFLLQKWVDGEPETLIGWQSSDLIDDVTAENLLGVAAAGPKILLLANEEPLAYVVDETFTEGDVALAAGTVTGEAMEGVFDDLVVWDAQPASDLLGLLEGPVPIAEETPEAEAALVFDPAVLDAIYAEEPVISESFTRDRGDWDTDSTESADRYFQDRAYHIHVLQPSSVSWTLAQQPLADFLAEVKTVHVSGPLSGEAGFLFRFEDDDNFYRFAITGEGGYGLDRMEAGNWLTIIEPTLSAALESGEGASNRIGVLAHGSRILLLANDQVLATVADDTFTKGDIGFVAGTYAEPGVDIAFDDLEIWDLSLLQDVAPFIRGTSAPEVEPAAFDIAVLETIRLEEPVVNESFTRDRGDWDTTATEEYGAFFLDRTYHIQVADPETLYWSQAGVELADILVEADVMFGTGPADTGAGFFLRRADADNTYLFTVQADGEYLFEKKVDGEWLTILPPTQSSAIAVGEGATNRLSVYANGGLLAFAANDVLLATVDDGAHAQGDVALAIVSGPEGGGEAAFDDLQIWDLAPLAEELPQVSAVPAPEVTTEPVEEATPAPELTPEPAPETVEPNAVLATIDEVRSSEPSYSLDLAADEDVFQDAAAVNGEDWLDFWDYAYLDGAYHVTVWEPDTLAASLTEISAGDFYLEVDTELIYDDLIPCGYGIMFRWEGDAWEGAGYLYGIDGSGSYQLMDEFLNGLTDYVEAEAISAGAGSVNRLGVLVQGSTITLLANDTVLDTIQDDAYRGGYIGLFAYSSWFAEESSEVAFSNLRVWDLAPLAEQLGPVVTVPVPSPEVTLEPVEEVTPVAVAEPADAAAIMATVNEIRSREPTDSISLAEDEGRVSIDDSGSPSVERGFSDDALHITVDVSNAAIEERYNAYGAATTDIVAGDFYLEVEAGPESGDTGEYGVLFRAEDPGFWYAFLIDHLGNHRLYKYSDDVPSSLISITVPNSDAIVRGEGIVNRLGLLVQGSTLVLLVNDSVLDVVQDDTFSEGQVGLLVRAPITGDVGKAAFRNLRVWDMKPSPLRATPQPVAATPIPEYFPLDQVTISAPAFDVCYQTISFPTVETRAAQIPELGMVTGDALVADVVKINYEACAYFTAVFYDEAGLEIGEPTPVIFEPEPLFPGSQVKAIIFLPEGWERAVRLVIQ